MDGGLTDMGVIMIYGPMGKFLSQYPGTLKSMKCFLGKSLKRLKITQDRGKGNVWNLKEKSGKVQILG